MLGDELAADLVKFANDATAVLRERVDGAHGLWLQDDSVAWAMKLPPGHTKGIRSSTDEVTVERLTENAVELDRRLGPLTVRFLKFSFASV